MSERLEKPKPDEKRLAILMTLRIPDSADVVLVAWPGLPGHLEAPIYERHPNSFSWTFIGFLRRHAIKAAQFIVDDSVVFTAQEFVQYCEKQSIEIVYPTVGVDASRN